jgi:hypothetical protein
MKSARANHRGVDLISDALPFGDLPYNVEWLAKVTTMLRR